MMTLWENYDEILTMLTIRVQGPTHRGGMISLVRIRREQGR